VSTGPGCHSGSSSDPQGQSIGQCPANPADQRDALAPDAVGEFGPVIGPKCTHDCDPDKAAQRALRIATARILCAQSMPETVIPARDS